MSAIGDYIHYRAKNYKRFGNSMNDSSSANEYNYSLQKTKILKDAAAARSKMTDNEKLELQKALGRILCTQVENDKVDKAVEQVQQEILSILEQTYGSSLGNINWDTGNVTAQSLLTDRNESLNRIRTKSKQKSIKLSTIIGRLKMIEETLPKVKNVKNKIELEKFIADIYNDLSDITNISINNLREDSGIDVKSINLDEKSNNLITDINSIIRVIGATPPVNIQKGDLFEYAIALAPAIAKANAEDAIEKEVLQKLAASVAGKDRSQIRIDFDNFSKSVNWSAMAVRGYQLDESGMFSILPSQEKIDVNLDLGNGKTAGISAKNVNLSSGFDVHILSGSSLLYMVQDMDTNFVNHFLNLTSTHPDSKEYIDESEVMQAREVMKITLLAKALSGQTYGRQAAEIFIVNDNSAVNTAVKIFEISSLIDKAATNFDAFVSLTAGGTGIDDIEFKNEWANEYTDRITSILQQVHQKKINAALKPAFLK